MRKSTLILGAILIFLVTCGGLFLLGGTLSPRLTAASAAASEHPDAFEAVNAVLASGSAPQVFSEDLPDPGDCRLLDATIALDNRGLIDAEWVSVTVDGAPGDIAVYSVSGEGGTVPARSAGSINVKLVTRDADAPRAYRVEYYVFGMKRSVAVQ